MPVDSYAGAWYLLSMSDNDIVEIEGGGGGGVPSGGASGSSSLPDGVTMIQEIEGGRFIRGAGGRFLPGTRSSHLITADNSRQMKERQKELTARLIAAEIGKRAGSAPPLAVALAAGDMWQQIVQSDKTNPRYRFDTWKGLAAAAELLADRREAAQDNGLTLSLSSDLARVLAEKLADLVARGRE